MHPYPTHQSVLAFDVEGFSDPYRDDSAQTVIRAGIYQLIQDALASAGVPWDLCVHEDRGDGAIVVVPPEISKVLLLDPLLGSLSAALVDYNRDARLAERIRLRLVLHAGEVAMDEHGLSGTDLIVACRLLEAEELRLALRHSPVPLAVIVSDGIYDSIVRHRFRNIDATTFHPVSIRVKRSRLHGWIHLPGTSAPPVIERDEPPSDSPRQLRADVATFVNRKRELRALDHAGRTSRLVVLVGPPGVGKTAFALHWAHRVRARYTGGQFYADLGGPGRPVALAEVFGRFLRALGVAPARVPLDVDEQATMFRSLTAGRRLLVLLDNVASAGQVRTLLPASDLSVTIVTSRVRLGGLIAEGAQFVEITRLSVPDGVELLSRTVGATRIKAEPNPARDLVALCGCLPIALCVAAARLLSHPKWTVQKLVTDLDGKRRLDRLSFGDDLSVKAVFDVSYQALSPPARRLYRLLGLHPGPDFDAGVAAAALATSRPEAERLVDELLTANLVEEIEEDRCRFHDLIRLHAISVAQTDESAADRTLGVRRMLDWYLDTATLAGQVVTPHRRNLRRDIEHVPVDQAAFGSHNEALDWLDRERTNLFAAAQAAFDQGLPDMTWQLADAMWGLFLFRTHYNDWMRFDHLAVQATQNSRTAEAETQDRLGLLYHALGRNDDALPYMARAADIWRSLGDRHRIASSTERFGFAYLDQGRAELAIEHFTAALAGYREVGEHRSAGLALISLGRALTESGRFAEATRYLHEAHTELSSLTIPDPYNTARALIALGRAETGAGTWPSAHTHLGSALTAMREVQSPLGEADALWALAELYEKTGDRTEARRLYSETEALLTELDSPAVTRVRAQRDALGPA
jgi:tetratricopeptide (TPR) repeat protein